MKLGVFEDQRYTRLYPLVYLRASYELKCGADKTLLARTEEKLGKGADVLFVRDLLEPVMKGRADGRAVNDLDVLDGDDVLLVNGIYLAVDDIVRKSDEETVGVNDDTVVYVRCSAEAYRKAKGADIHETIGNLKKALKNLEVDATVIRYPWNLIQVNGRCITLDFEDFAAGIHGHFSEQAAVHGLTAKVHVAKGAEVHPFVVLDTGNGPIIIDEGAKLQPFTRIEGPGYVGKKTQLFRANVTADVSFGPVCRAGGEVEASIFHGYSNKHHKGFIGHAYVCEWVNLGALTTNSDLKIDYGNVDVWWGQQGRLLHR